MFIISGRGVLLGLVLCSLLPQAAQIGVDGPADAPYLTTRQPVSQTISGLPNAEAALGLSLGSSGGAEFRNHGGALEQQSTGDENWADLFTLPGTNNAGTEMTPVVALATYGGSVYIGGSFTVAGMVVAKGIAKWDGRNWSALGSGIDAGKVNALAVDAGGVFTTAGGVTAGNIAKWDGTSWSALGGGLEGPVSSLTIDGRGNLYAGGFFANLTPPPNPWSSSHTGVAKWDGSNWSALGEWTGARSLPW